MYFPNCVFDVLFPRLRKQGSCKIAVTVFDPLEEAISDHDLKYVFSKS